jgi:hypothetical protein
MFHADPIPYQELKILKTATTLRLLVTFTDGLKLQVTSEMRPSAAGGEKMSVTGWRSRAIITFWYAKSSDSQLSIILFNERETLI